MFRETNDIGYFLTVSQRADFSRTSLSSKVNWCTAVLLGLLFAFSCQEPLAPVHDNAHDSANPFGKPDAPTNLQVSALAADTVAFSWRDNSTFRTGFEIEWSENGLSFSLLKTVGDRDTSATVSLPLVNRRQFFRVRAKTDLTYSLFSDVATLDLRNMIFVQGGTFQMGSPDGVGHPDEWPQHTVTLKSYWLDQTETTVADYQRFCLATNRDMPERPSWGWQDNHPIVYVSWSDANAYAQWAGKRLPTEAEWEYAAKGGKHSRGYNFSGSNYLDSVAWTHVNSGDSTHPVKSKAPNELALYDMSGNVWEWCQDWYHSNYDSAPLDGSAWLTPGMRQVYRGGGWRVYPLEEELFRVTVRSQGDLGDKLFVSLGFRCARDCSISRK